MNVAWFPPCSVCGVRPPAGAAAAGADRVDRPGPRLVQRHGVRGHLFPPGKLHRAQQQGAGPGGPRRAGGGAGGAASLPGPAGDAGRQRPPPVLLHQQGPGEVQLQRVRGHLLRGVHVQRDRRLGPPLQGVDGADGGGGGGHAVRPDHGVRRRRFTAHLAGGFRHVEDDEEDGVTRSSNFIYAAPLNRTKQQKS